MGVQAKPKDGETGIAHTAGVEGRLWSEVAVASLKHPWDNKMRLPDESGGKDRRATFDDVGCHKLTT